MKIHTTFAVSALVLVALVLVNQASAQSDALSLANLAVSPQPVLAGGNLTLQFQLYNSYEDTLTNVNLELEGSYPILNSSPTDTTLISNIPTGLYGGTYFLYYNLHIPKHVNSGTYTIDVVAEYQAETEQGVYESGSSTMPITFYVRGVPNLEFTASSQSGISPGSQSTVTLSVLNVGTDNATDVSVSIPNSRNFSVVGASTFNLGTIAPQKAAMASAILLANSTVGQGNAAFPIVVNYGTQYNSTVYTYNQSVPVTVSLGNPDISIGVTGANPSSLYPGTNQSITLSVQNIGSGTAKNVTLFVPGTGNITAASSASKIFLGTIAAGASTTTSVLITANKNDNMDKYNLPVYVSYQNANYNSTANKTIDIPIALQSIARFNITSESGDIAPGGSYVPVTLQVRNTGNEPAQTVTFTLQTIYPISQITPNAYVASLEPGQTTNVTFYVNIASQANPGEYPLSLYEQWTQPGGATSGQYSASQNYYVTVQNSGGGGQVLNIIIGAIVVVALVFFIRKRMKQGTSTKKK